MPYIVDMLAIPDVRGLENIHKLEVVLLRRVEGCHGAIVILPELLDAAFHDFIVIFIFGAIRSIADAA